MLSGGERSRLELALLGIQPANLLLLDEPTNHLDIPAREAIEAFLSGSPATLLVVSHDRRLLETVCEQLWVVGDGAAVAFDGGVSRVAGGGRRRLDDRGCARAGGGAAAAATVGRPGTRSAATYGAAPNGRSARAPGRPPAAGDQHTARKQEESGEEGQALEGRVPAAGRLLRGGADAAGLAQEPARAGAGRSGGAGELRRAAAGDQRARGRRRGAGGGRGRLARARGAARRDAIRIGLDRTDRLRQVHGRRLARRAAGRRRHRRGRRRARRRSTRASRRSTRSSSRFGAGPVARTTARSIGRRSAAIVFADPAALADLEAIVHPAVRPRIMAADRGGGRGGRGTSS